MDNKYAVIALNVISGAALLGAATWFSFNLFAARDAAVPTTIITIEKADVIVR